MKSGGAVQFALAAILVVTCSASPRRLVRRQAHVEFKAHFFPFKEMCAKRMNLPTSSIRQYLAFGIPGGKYCSYFVLQCEDLRGKVARYLEQCGIGMWWSFKTDTCDIPSLADRPACSKEICPPSGEGSVPDPRACYGFYECTGGRAFFEMCEDTSFFNPKTKSCENSPTCDRPGMKTRPNGQPCQLSDLPRVCTPPGYVPSLAYCGCVHQHLER